MSTTPQLKTARPGSIVVWGLVLSIGVFAIAVSTGAWYETNDDVLMNAFAAGTFVTTARDEHLLFTNVLIGFVLKTAYGISSEIPWYGLYLLLTLAAVAGAVVWAFADLLRSWSGRLLVFAFLIATVSTTVTHLQFTRVAFLSVESGWLLIATAIARRLPQHRKAAAMGAALVLLGTCIRATMGFLGTILSAPVLVVAVGIAFSGSPWPHRRRILGVLAAIVVAGVMSYAFDQAYYGADTSWRRFRAYQSRRGVFTDSGRVSQSQVPTSVLEHVGWSLNDLSMMQNWFGLHSVFSLEKQDYVLAQAARVRGLFDPASVRNWRPLETNRLLWLFLAITVTSLALAATRTSIAGVTGSVLLLGGVLGYFIVGWQLPPRFFEPALSAPAATGLFLLVWGGPQNRRLREVFERLVMVGCGVTLLLGLASLRETWQGAREQAERHGELVRNIRARNPTPEQLYVLWADFNVEDLVTPLGQFSDAGAFQVVMLGWPNYSPHSMRRLHQFGIGDLYVDLWRKGHVFLIAAQDRCPSLGEFIATHYGQVVECDSVDPNLPIPAVIPVSVRGPSIGVRWHGAVFLEARQRLEQKYGLRRPRLGSDRTWRYELTDSSAPLMLRLIGDQWVEDTAGLDRQTGRLVRPEPDW